MNEPQPAAPIEDFSRCHAGIVRKLDLLGDLPALLEPAQRARRIAETSAEFFRAAIFEHHLDEERELFPAVLAHAAAGAEEDRVRAMVRQLTDQHRALEALWKHLEPGLKRLARGQPAEIDAAEISRLVADYKSHAAFEEAEFLPLAQQILGRNANHLAALGWSLHMRHVDIDTVPTHL